MTELIGAMRFSRWPITRGGEAMLRATVAAVILVATMFTNAFLQTASAEVKPGEHDHLAERRQDPGSGLARHALQGEPGDEHENRPHLAPRLAASIQGGDREVL